MKQAVLEYNEFPVIGGSLVGARQYSECAHNKQTIKEIHLILL